MKILKPTAYYYPENVAGSHLNSDLEKELVKRNIFIKIITPIPSRGINKEIRIKYKNIKHEVNEDGKIEIIRFSLFKEPKKVIFRAFRYILSIYKQYRIGIKQKDIDLVFVESTPPIQGILGVRLKKKLKVPFVYVVQDIFPDSLLNTNIIKRKGFIWFIGRLIENYSYKHADKIIVISDDFKINLINKKINANKIDVISNWIDTDFVKFISRENNYIFNEYNIDKKKFIVTYCGNLGMTQNLELILNAAKNISQTNLEILFIFIGEGVNKKSLVEQVDSMNLANIRFLPFQDYNKISEVFSLGDVGIIVSKRNIGTNSVPSKLLTMLSASQCVLASFDIESEVAKIVNQSKSGICVEAENIDLFMEKLKFLYKNRNLVIEFGNNGREYVTKKFNKLSNTEKYIDVFVNISKINRS